MKTIASLCLFVFFLSATPARAATIPIQDVLPGWTQDYRQPVSELIALRRAAGETSGSVCVGVCFKLPDLDLNWNYFLPAALAVTLPPLLSFAFDGGRAAPPDATLPPVIPPDGPPPAPVPEPRSLVLIALALAAAGTRRAWRRLRCA